MPVGEAKINLDKTGTISSHENLKLKLSPEIPSLLSFCRTLQIAREPWVRKSLTHVS